MESRTQLPQQNTTAPDLTAARPHYALPPTTSTIYAFTHAVGYNGLVHIYIYATVLLAVN